MVETLTRNKIIYEFSKGNEPAKFIDSGTTIEVETYDCFENQLKTKADKISSLDWNRINPATGPIFVNGAEPGDILKVKINRIWIAEQGVIATGPNLGVMGHQIDEFASKIIPIENNVAKFNDKVDIPLNPMIGVIGVAPEGDAISCGTPGSHGGNMDTKIIAEGATLYFPVFVKGALLALGDFHAAMGDGEVGGAGIEVPGRASLTIDVIKDTSINHPIVTNDDGISFVVSAPTIDEAIEIAAQEAIKFLLPFTNMSLEELTMLMSAVGQTKISQIVDPLMTARFLVPQFILDAYEIKGFK